MLSIFDVRVRFFMRAFVPFVGYFTRTRFFFGISSTSRRSDDATYSIYKTDYNSGKRFRAL